MHTEDRTHFYSRLGEAIRHRRISSGLTQLQLSKMVGLSRTSIFNIECGKQGVSSYNFWRISDALGGLHF